MSTQQVLPLLDLTSSRHDISKLRHAIRKWGAFRLSAPKIQRAFADCVPHVSFTFRNWQRLYTKMLILAGAGFFLKF